MDIFRSHEEVGEGRGGGMASGSYRVGGIVWGWVGVGVRVRVEVGVGLGLGLGLRISHRKRRLGWTFLAGRKTWAKGGVGVIALGSYGVGVRVGVGLGLGLGLGWAGSWLRLGLKVMVMVRVTTFSTARGKYGMGGVRQALPGPIGRARCGFGLWWLFWPTYPRIQYVMCLSFRATIYLASLCSP